jgi:hypothetical protein
VDFLESSQFGDVVGSGFELFALLLHFVFFFHELVLFLATLDLQILDQLAYFLHLQLLLLLDWVLLGFSLDFLDPVPLVS